MLVEAKADLNAIGGYIGDPFFGTPVFWSCERGGEDDLEVCRLLVEAKSDVNAKGNGYDPPCMRA